MRFNVVVVIYERVVAMGISRGKLAGPRKLLLYADHGIGKSSFAAGAPNPLFIDIEGGTHDLDIARWDEPVNNYLKFIEVLNFVYSQDHGFFTLVIDSADWLERLIFNHIAGRAGVETVSDIDYGKGMPRAIPMWETVLNWLQAIHRDRKMMVILLAHTKIEHVSNPEGQEYDRFSPGLFTNKNGEGAGKIIQEWTDEVFFMRKKKFVRTEDVGFNKTRGIAVGTEEREILVSESAFASAKNRLNMPSVVSLPQVNAWSVYAQYMRANHAKPVHVAPQGMATIQPVQGDLEGVVVNGSSKKESPLIAEMEKHFGNDNAS